MNSVSRMREDSWNRPALAGLVAASLLTCAAPATAQLTTTTLACTPQIDPVQSRLIQWDITAVTDIVPGSLVVDDRSSSRHSQVWFATRNGETRVYRFTPGRAIRKDPGEAKSWPLGASQTGGVRLRHSNDGRFVFVNVIDDGGAANALVAVDTRDNTRVTWVDRPQQGHMSDVSVDTRGDRYSVFTAALAYQAPTEAAPFGGDGVVQRLRPGQPKYRTDANGNPVVVVPAEVTRWPVGGGAGTCFDTGAGSPCIPGIALDRRHGHPIYFSAPEFINKDGSVGAVGELDPRPAKCDLLDQYNSCAKVRYWPLPAGTASPRQVLVDDHGKVWGITSSGHLFSLDIERNYDRAEVTRHDPVGPLPEDLFAVAPDGGIIGFTDSENNEVSVLFPERSVQKITPTVKLVRPVTRTIEGIREAAKPEAHLVAPREAIAEGIKYTNPGDGTYVETNVSTGVAASGSPDPSFFPTGMAPDGARKTGSFFYGVTFSGGSNRIGHFESGVEPDRELSYRRDDDDYDDDGEDDYYDTDDDGDGYDDDVDDDDDNDCILDVMDRDHDNDGVENEHDSRSHRENKRTDRGSMGPGQSKSYEMESDANSVAMVAIVEAADPLTPLSLELVDPNGVVVLSTPPVLGKAIATATPALPGIYTIRVKNGGLSSTTYKATLIGKSIWF